MSDRLFEELIGHVGDCCRNRPRNLQLRIGPSGIGEPCERALIDALTRAEVKPERPNWRAEVGTAVHEHLGLMFADRNTYLVEHPVLVGYLGGEPIEGHADLFHIPCGTVVDWKTKSATTLDMHKRKGPGQRYAVQSQLYGLGMAAQGYEVREVMIVFVPRDGELRDSFHYSAPFDPAAGLAALLRAEQLLTLARNFGAEAAKSLFHPCHDEWCRTCSDPSKIYPGRARVASADNPFALNF